MIRYFALQSMHQDRIASFADADRLAERMIEKLSAFDVRLLAIRNRGVSGFVFGYTSRLDLAPQSVVSKLRNEPEFAGYRISEEEPKVEGPFDAKKAKAAVAHQRPS